MTFYNAVATIGLQAYKKEREGMPPVKTCPWLWTVRAFAQSLVRLDTAEILLEKRQGTLNLLEWTDGI